MRIVHLAESFWPRIGGGEIFISELARSLQARGHACQIVTNELQGLPAAEDRDGLPIRRLPFTRPLLQRDLPGILRVSAQLRELLTDWQPDLLHLHSQYAISFYFLRVGPTLKIPSLYTTHVPFVLQQAPNPAVAAILNTVDAIVAISDAMRRQIITLNPAHTAKTRLIYNGLARPNLSPGPLPQNPSVLLAAARLVPEKGLDVLLRSLPTVLQDFPTLQTIVGGDGPERAPLEHLAVELGISHAVSFPGWLDPQQVPVQMNRATLTVVPSRWQEPFGLVAIQSMQVARPVVASRVGGIPEIVKDGETGLLVPPDDPAALSHAILRILHNPVKAAQMGLRGRERAEHLFGWERCITEYERLYSDLLP